MWILRTRRPPFQSWLRFLKDNPKWVLPASKQARVAVESNLSCQVSSQEVSCQRSRHGLRSGELNPTTSWKAKQSQSNRSEPELSDASQRNELTWQLSYDNDSLRPEFAGDTCAPGRYLRHQGHLMRTRVVWLAISSEIPLPWL